MDKQKLYIIITALVLLYPVITLFNLAGSFSEAADPQIAGKALRNYLSSVWVVWVVITVLAVQFKWTTGRNLFFFVVYGIVLVGFTIYGYYVQRMITVYELPNSFDDNHSYGIFAFLQHTLSASILTGLLQAAVWWFTRRWHRR